MRSPSKRPSAGALLCLAVLVASLAAPADSPFLSPGELRRGMRGYGLSVFEGTRIRRFPITVLGVVPRQLGGADLILIRVDGGYPVEHATGIIAGMSGSPIYVQGRLIGALAYGWPFSREPIGGVTPIQSMLSELPGREVASGEALSAPWSRSAPLPQPIRAAGRQLHQVRLCRLPPRKPTPGVLELSPVGSLLQTGGMGERALEMLRKGLEPLPLQVGPAGSGSPAGVPVPPLRPGAAVGVQLLAGDLEIAGNGTLTWREGNRVLAFGHPMAGLGEVSLPLTASYVETVMPSQAFSFKLTRQIGVVGSLTRDRLWAVGGELHSPVSMMPATLRVRDPEQKRQRTYRFKAAQHPRLTPALLAAALVQGLSAVSPSMADRSARVHYRLEPAGQPPVEYEDLAAGPQADSALGAGLLADLSRLLDNPFEPLRLGRVEMEVEVLPGRRTALLQRLTTDRVSYRPGETVHLEVQLKPRGGEAVRRELEIPLPPDAAGGEVRLGVSGGDERALLEKQLGLSEPEVLDLAGLLRRLETRERSQHLAVRAVFPKEGLVMGQEPFPLLPEGLRLALSRSPDSQVVLRKDLFSHSEATPWAVKGREVITVRVEGGGDNEKAEKKEEERKAGGPVDALPGGGRRWRLQGEALEEGSFQGLAVDSRGTLVPAWERTSLYRSGETAVWCLERAWAGTLLAGVGVGGEIVRVGPERGLFARTGGAAVLSLEWDGERLWAGTGPRGEIDAYDRAGRRLWRSRLPVTYVWALRAAPRGGCYAATGLPGRLYHLDRSGRARLLWESPEHHLRGLTAGPAGELYLGTANRGLIYRFQPGARRADVLYRSGHPSVESLDCDGERLFAAAGPELLRLELGEEGEVSACRRFILGREPVLAVAADGRGGAWAGCAGRDGVAHLSPSGEVLRTPLEREAPVLALLREPQGVLAAQGFFAEVLRLKPSAQGVYRSRVLDAGVPSRWGEVRWLGSGKVAVETRSGPTAPPDTTWSPWSVALSRPQRVLSPPDRYLQVRVRLEEPARVGGIEVSFRPLGDPPRVTLVAPAGGERWSGRRGVRWKLEGGEAERISFNLWVSALGQESWQALFQGRPARKGRGEVEEFSWDTTRHPDGIYRLRLEAYDRTRPEDSRASIRVLSPPLVIANRGPRLAWLEARPLGRWVEVRGLALGGVAAIVEVRYRTGQGDWLPAIPADGLFDSPREEFRLVVEENATVEIRARDEAGNEATLSRGL